MAAGASTRMKTQRSKLLYPLMGFSVIERAWNQAAFLGSEVCLVVGHQRAEVEGSVREYLQLTGLSQARKTSFAIQDPPRGTGDAVRQALKTFSAEDAQNTHVFIFGGDNVLLRPESLKAFADRYFIQNADLSLITTQMPPERNYGRIVRDSSGELSEIVEAKNCSAEQLRILEVNAGFYLMKLSLLIEAAQNLTANDKTGEFYLTDILAYARKNGRKTTSYFLGDSSEALGINTQEEFSLARRILQMRINARWMAEGVCMDDPAATWIDETVELGPDVYLGMQVILRGRTRVASGVSVEAFSIIEDSSVASGAVVGPYARLRPGCVLEEKVKIGNFVEAKKSHFRKSSKANHLSYIGDAEIGESANIGAGTITCNFDGFSKFKTKIGKSVLIGSNSSLVAPVEIGDEAVVGAGSVITENVAAQEMAMTRVEQKNLAQAGKRFREKRRDAGGK